MTDKAPPFSTTLRQWTPVLVWGAIIFTFSTSSFSSDKTGQIIVPLLRWLFPLMGAIEINNWHILIRKLAHFTEYSVLFFLLIRGPMRGRPLTALAMCAVYALLDEGHQLFVPKRGPSLYDVAIDCSGAMFVNFVTIAVS